MELTICDLLYYVYQQSNKAFLFLWSAVVEVFSDGRADFKIFKVCFESLVERWEEKKFSWYVKLLFILKEFHNKEI